MPTHCHLPNGGSTYQFLHYGQEKGPGYGFQISNDANFSSITVPMSLYYSTGDTFTTQEDVDSYIARIKSIKQVQVVNNTEFNEYDFVWSDRAAKILYPGIMKFLESFD